MPEPEVASTLALSVKYFHEIPGVGTGNIIWAERDRGSPYYRVSKFGMNAGRFPKDHPCAQGDGRSNARSECGDSESLRNFRALGYWASCFPEGDGITMRCERGQNTAAVVRDIQECFGWRVDVKRGDPTPEVAHA